MHVIDNLVWKSVRSSVIVSFGEIPRDGISSQLVSSYMLVSRVMGLSWFAQSFPVLESPLHGGKAEQLVILFE